MSKWNTIKIGELILSNQANLQTGPFGTQLKASDYVSEGTPVINVRNIGFGEVRNSDLEYLDENFTQKLAVHQLREGDIVFGRKGAVDRHALIRAENDGWIQGSDCLRLRLYTNQVLPRFLSYYFNTNAHKKWMEALCSFGATMSSLNQDIVKRISFPAPPRPIQEKIAAVLSAHDDLIENNKKRIGLLEKAAEEIYREWFLRMRFPGWKIEEFAKGIPKKWETKKALYYFGYVKGKSYLGQEINENGNGLPFVNLKSINRGGGYRRDGIKYYQGRYRESQLVYPGDVVMALTDMTQNRDVVGRAARIPDDFDKYVISLDILRLVPKNISKSFLYAFLQYSGFGNSVKEFANGANVLHLSAEVIVKQDVLIPPLDLRNMFDEVFEPILKNLDILEAKNHALERSRALILPRLISGKLSLDELDIHFPPSIIAD